MFNKCKVNLLTATEMKNSGRLERAKERKTISFHRGIVMVTSKLWPLIVHVRHIHCEKDCYMSKGGQSDASQDNESSLLAFESWKQWKPSNAKTILMGELHGNTSEYVKVPI